MVVYDPQDPNKGTYDVDDGALQPLFYLSACFLTPAFQRLPCGHCQTGIIVLHLIWMEHSCS